MSHAPERFDARYYRRFYLNPRTRAGTAHSAACQAAFIHAYLRYLEVPVTRVLDVGCGLGRHLRAFARLYPRARCVGVELSPYLCRRFGWRNGSAVDFRSRVPFDLVICSDVLPSLDDRACARAITNLARLTRGALFLGVLTSEDKKQADLRRTDLDVFTRPAAWYRRRLARHFVAVGGGLFIRKPVSIALWALEKTG
jgi:SAM-dependent methyltransferase